MDIMKKTTTLILVLAGLLALASCGKDKEVETFPLFWTWMDYRPGMDFEAACAHMQEVGIEGVMLNAPTPDDYRAAIPIAHAHGITVHAWLWTMNLEHDRRR